MGISRRTASSRFEKPWKGDRASRPVELGEAIGRLTRELSALSKAEARGTLVENHGLELRAA